jgi:hypothetical protein
MSDTPRLPEPEHLPHLTRRSLIVHWETDTNVVWIDSSGLSCFDVSGLLRVAIDLAEMDLPLEDYDPEESEND